MFHLALALVLASTPVTPRTSPDLYQGALTAPAGVLLPELSGRHPHPPGSVVRSSISNIVAGSILIVLGAGSATGGVAALVGAGNSTGSDRTVFTVLGWTFTGIGILLGVIGIPLFIVGIANLASPGLAKHLSVSPEGNLAVRF